ncbi:receptor-like protein kinase 7 [Andrographis paniculata]|uniref:receptor-like protein kinase 7 n=1 Tax=Andrographis paniculata TaxID=175694 RepID=UPI0021E7E572|nr:receptor-like protein kinase 7 [Andrographis paniculata]
MAAPTVFLLLTLISAAVSDDLHSLLSIKSALGDSNHTLFSSWQSDSPICTFQGITCNAAGDVAGIDLTYRNISGELPVAAICEIKSLETLALGFNTLHGRVTNDLNNCFSLKYLDLGNNFFSGEFPDISSVAGLVSLHLNNSGFSGTFPWNSLRNMSDLQALSLGDNPFLRSPFPAAILNLTKLNWLYLTNCSIEGTIPEEIGNLVDLVNLELADNFLSGEIPAGITKLRRLWQLELFSNDLTGELPPGFGNLINLEFFDASNNSLRGNLSEIRFLNKLQSLQLYKNNFSGEVPGELGNFKQLVNLSLYINNLTGQLPEKLGSWSEFNFIDVSENSLTGPIPPEMCKKGKMMKLLILQNKFTGGIPKSYSGCRELIRFRVNDNGLSGAIPAGIWGLPNLQILDLSGNDFEGPIEPEIGNAASLGQLYLANNRFSGELPPAITNATSLWSIDLQSNRFTGEIPATIGGLDQLSTIQLQGNEFSGSIPDSLASCRSLNEINFAGNRLTGVIPASLGSLPTLNFLNLSRNRLSGPIPGALSSLRLNLLDLSDNRLTGPIPNSLASEASNGSFAGNSALCSGSIRGFRRCSPDSGMPGHLRAILLCLLVASVVMLISVSTFCYVKKKSECAGERSLKDGSWDVKSFHILTFSEDDILDSIKPENLIGKGGSGNVYRAVVGNGKEFAVKHIWHADEYAAGRKNIGSSTPILARPARTNKSREFDAEVQTLSSIRHINVVKLYCSIISDESSLLVYEYMPNGSLWDRLHTCKKLPLDWQSRYDIAVGAAQGLEYLHHGCDRPVIHRDVKSSNILLDEDLKPRIADFGLAKILQADVSKESTQVVAGTHGYIAPEYAYSSKASEKGDVYSFGVVLLELVTGRRPIEPEFGESKDIVEWVNSNLKSKDRVMNMVVDRVLDEVEKGEALKVLRVGILCTARNPSVRPTMKSVVQMLVEARPCRMVTIVFGKDKEEFSCKADSQ